MRFPSFCLKNLTLALGLTSVFVCIAQTDVCFNPIGSVQAAQTQNTKITTAKKTTAKKSVKKTSQKTIKKSSSNVKKTNDVSEKRRKELQNQQKSLREELGALKKELSKNEASRSEAADALAASEVAISNANRRLRDLGNEKLEIETQLKSLKEDERAVSGQLTVAERKKRLIARAQFVNMRRESWKSLINGQNPHQVARDAAALQYMADAQAVKVSELSDEKSTIHNVSQKTQQKRQELANVEKNERNSRAQLIKEQESRKNTIEKLKQQIASQRASIDKLERDEKRLGELVSNIDRVLAQRAAEAKRKAQAARQKQTATKSTPAAVKYTGKFSKMRGKLLMPTLGKIIGQYGKPRKNISGKSTTWKGLMIQAKAGSSVLACANGQVVFADWMRGFGNLIIVNHDDGYLSIYANTESIYKSVGDTVERGDTIATVGNSGGEDKSGLYFELRRNGTPFNPLPWIGKDK